MERLAGMLELERANNRGLPLTPIQSVCLTLSHFGGAHFNRVSAYCGNVSHHAAHDAIDRVRRGILNLKDEFIRLPSEAEMAATAGRLLDRFHLPDFSYGIDGMMVRFDGAPCGLPVGPGYPILRNFNTRDANVTFV